MKRFARIGLLLFVCAVLVCAGLAAAAPLTIINSKHDLSSGNTTAGVIKSTGMGTDEKCVFCHTPHSARNDAPLWNRTDVSQAYATYTSDVLSTVGLTPEDPLSGTSLGYKAHVKTRICLSCHDGTIALGNLVNLPNGLSSNIPMQGTGIDALGKMTSAAAGYLGLDLRDDHPVAVKHLNSGDPELLAVLGGSRVKLYKAADARPTTDGLLGAYVECTSCHDPHDNEWGNFLIESNLGSALCRDCHQKQTAGITGAHDNSTTGYNPDGLGKIGTSVGQVQCMNCHYSHRAGASGAASPFGENPSSGKYLLSFQEDGSCFNNPNRFKAGSNTACHGTGGQGDSSKNIDIQTQVNKSNAAHSALRNGSFNPSYSNKHAATEQGLSGNGKYGTITTHVVCSDCHNPHTAGKTSHAQGTNTIATNSPLYGAGGVAFAGGLGSWTVPIQGNYNAYESLGVTSSNSWLLPKYEYEICFKCHTSFAWGGGGKPNISDLSGILSMTDQLQEFNPANPSYHTVMTGLNTANSYQPPAPGSWANSWSSASLMYCSDCHGNDTSIAQPQGPHGSANPGMLVLPFGDLYGTVGGTAQQNTELCFKCHSYAVYGQVGFNTLNNLSTGFSTTSNINLHTQHAYRERSGFTTLVTNPWSYKCVNCHTRVSHGWKRRGLVVFQGDGAGYEAGGFNSGPILNTATLPAAPGANQYGIGINYNCSIQGGVTGCHHN